MPLRKVLIAVVMCPLLAGCSYAVDAGNTSAPDWIPHRKPYETPHEQEPDLHQIVKDNPNSLFVGTPQNIQLSKPRLNGYHWEACASATTADIAGHPSQTMVVFPIEGGRIGERTRVEPGHWCFSETLSPL
jgi:hypothetical protein